MQDSSVYSNVTIVTLSHSISKANGPISLMSDVDDILQSIFGTAENVQRLKKAHFRKSPFVVSGSKDRISEICENLYDLDVQTYLENTASDQIHVWLAAKPTEGSHQTKKRERDSTAEPIFTPPLESISLDDPRQACLLHQVGHSLYCRAPAELEASVIPRVLASLGLGIPNGPSDRFSRGEIETFFSRQGHNTDFHIDFQDNITIQLSGKKRWIFRGSHCRHPIRGCTPHYNGRSAGKAVAEQQLKLHRICNPHFQADEYRQADAVLVCPPPQAAAEDEEETVAAPSRNKLKPSSAHTKRQDVLEEASCHEVVLSAGDVLYHPPGIWHRVECLEDSVSINISLITASYAEVFCSGLQQLLWRQPQFRAPVKCDAFSASGEEDGPPNIMNSLIAYVASQLSSMSGQHFLPVSTQQPPVVSEKEAETGLYGDAFIVRLLTGCGCKIDSKLGITSSSGKHKKSSNVTKRNNSIVASKDGGGGDDDDDDEEEEEEGQDVEPSHVFISADKICASEALLRYVAQSIAWTRNPLASMLLAEDISKLGISEELYAAEAQNQNQNQDQDQDRESARHVSAIVSTSFGNEGIESLSRKIVLVPVAWRAELQALLEATSYDRFIVEAMADVPTSKINTDHAGCNLIRVKLLLAFMMAGAFSVNNVTM